MPNKVKRIASFEIVHERCLLALAQGRSRTMRFPMVSTSYELSTGSDLFELLKRIERKKP
ncbi:hypothetical protein [Methylomicrobium album]|uniref:hypothetical protein n=1 Tax=Methylomicrobium album TaxID=39775 RepID=UPI00058D34B3|nr:hypothetical protein [Methylomicrobium album]